MLSLDLMHGVTSFYCGRTAGWVRREEEEKQHQRRLSFRLEEEEEEWEAVFVSDMSVVELLDVGRLVVLMKEEGAAEVEEAEEEEEDLR